MKFMKEQEYEILKLESGELVIKQYQNSIGEIMFYDGSLRIAITPETWDRVKTIIIDLIDNALEKTKTQDGNV